MRVLRGCVLAVLIAVPAAADEVVSEGVRLRFDLAPADGSAVEADAPGRFSFTLSDAETGRPYDDGRLAAWLDRREAGAGATCQARIAAFVQGGLARQPQLDLNRWQLAVLDDRGGVVVIDPISGFGGTKVVTRVPLDGAAEDWVLDERAGRLHVLQPDIRRLATVDVATWKVTRQQDVGARPHRLALAPDGASLWVLHAAASTPTGVTVIDAADGARVAETAVGQGPHSLAFGRAGKAVVTSAGSGTATVLGADGTVLASVAAGKKPVAAAYSPLAEAFLVADEAEGALVAVDEASHEMRPGPVLGAGIVALGVSPDGRWAFALDGRNDRLHVIDVATLRVWRSIKVDGAPYQVSFSERFAYLRLARQAAVAIVALDGLGGQDGPQVQVVPTGQTPPARSGRLETAAAMAPLPDRDGMLIGMPGDRAVYYYREGAVAPMGSFATGQGRPRAVAVVDRSLRTVAPGRYETVLPLPEAGAYELAVLVDQPPIQHCFLVEIAASPIRAAAPGKPGLEFLDAPRTVAAGSPVTLKFRVSDQAKGAKFEMLTTLVPGQWRAVTPARETAPQVYEASFEPPRPGAYYVYVGSSSLGLSWHQLPFLTLDVTEPAR